jgi:hypothetical protein
VSYSVIGLAAQDQHLRTRIAACIAQEDPHGEGHPVARADAMQWQVVASPGLGDAYGYALSTSVPDPGNDPAVITDGALLAAVAQFLPQAG